MNVILQQHNAPVSTPRCTPSMKELNTYAVTAFQPVTLVSCGLLYMESPIDPKPVVTLVDGPRTVWSLASWKMEIEPVVQVVTFCSTTVQVDTKPLSTRLGRKEVVATNRDIDVCEVDTVVDLS
jgi:hypothetical protein